MQDTPQTAPGRSVTPLPFYILGLMWATYTIQGLDRSILLILLEPIRHAFDLNDSQIGLLSGMGYAVPFAISCLPLGALADKVNRKWLLIVLLVVWSICTALSGLAGSFVMLLVARAMVGLSESGAPPTMLSILSDRIPPARRGLAMSLFYTAPPAGNVVGLLLGGAVAAEHGWRMALFIAALPGLFTAVLLAITVREPERGSFDTVKAPEASFREVLALLRRERRLQLVIGNLILVGLITAGINSWLPPLLIRVYHFNILKAAQLAAAAGLIGSPLGSLAGGYLCSRFSLTQQTQLLRWLGILFAIITPLNIVLILSGQPMPAVVMIAIWAFSSGIMLGPAFAMMLNWTPAAMRGRMLSLQLLASYLFGMGVGPQIIGSLSDLFTALGDPDNLPHAFAVLLAITIVPAALMLGTKSVDRPEPSA